MRAMGVEERRFTISSAPYEGEVHVTTRPSRSEFKQMLFGLQPGALIDAYAIDGSFVWPDDVRDPVFLAAGIGITPYYAMLKQRVFEGKPLDATLLYGGSDRQFAFHGMLDAWQQAHPGFAVHYLPGPRFGPAFVTNTYKKFGGNRMYYVSGPPGLVDTVVAVMGHNGLPAEQLKRDWFTGARP